MKKPLPDHAKLVYQGKLLKVYQWEQEMYDGSREIFEKAVRPDSVEVISVVEGKILILDQEQPHKDPYIGIPGGRVDEGEDMLDAAKRELLEETGYASDDIQLWKTVEDTGMIMWKRGICIARNCIKKQEATPDNGEKISVRFIDFDEFLLLSENQLFRTKSGLREMLFIARLHPEKYTDFKKLLGL